MRGYNADTMLRLARCDLAEPVAMEQFLKGCTRASHGRYRIARPGVLVESIFACAGIALFISMIPIAYPAAWANCGFPIALVDLALTGLLYMAVADLRILRSVRRTRAGNCAICGYQIDAVPPPGAIAAIATCPECGEEVIVGRAPRAPTDDVPYIASRPPQLESPST